MVAKRRNISALSLKAEQAFKRAVCNIIEERQRTGESLIIWRDGKVVRVPACSIHKK